MIAFALRLGRALTPTAWLALAVLAAFLIFGAYCAHRGADGVRDQHTAEALKVDHRASASRATRGEERGAETTSINNREKDLTHAVQPFPDARPSPGRVALTCERLRQQGTAERLLPGPCRSDG